MREISRRDFLKGTAASFAAVAFGTSLVGTTALASDDSLHDTANIDNSFTRSSLVVGWNTATSIEPWGTDNNVPGNYEVYEMLFETSADGEFYALLADASRGEYGGYDHEEGSVEYRVYIYDYIYDHAGNHITASDIAYSYMYQYENATTSNWQTLVSVEAEDDTTVLFTFTEELNSLGALENFLSRCFIVSENNTENLTSSMCGTGPYKFVSYTSGSSLVIEKNEDYWQTDESLRRQESQANVQTITYQFVDEGNSRETGLQSGALDMVYDMPLENIETFTDDGSYGDQYSVYSYVQKFVYGLCLNCSEDMPTGDVNLRLAILNAIDQNGLITALGGTYTRLYAYATDYYSDYSYVDWASLDNYNTNDGADLEAAAEYLAASSYNGETLTVLTQSDYNDVATIIAAQLAAAGINATVKGVDQATQTSTLADSSAWDMMFGMMAGDYNVQVWSHGFDYNSNGGTGTANGYFTVDDEWQELLELCNTAEGHTAENMLAWWQMCTDNGYAMGLYAGNNYDIVPEDCTYVCLSDRLNLLPGACCFDGSVE
ncbi:MAG: ABC transporter substrate-binding protein [Lachnospiraceae bacterium]|nr:ABC transporter substrate-binding protein [Lachnospiraceae bacterium]